MSSAAEGWVSVFGLQLVRIRLLVVMLVWELSVLLVLPLLSPPLLTLPTGKGGVVHLFVVYGNQGAEEDADQLLLSDKLLQAVLAEAHVVCIGQPMLIAGDLNVDPSVIPCLAKGISAGRYVDLALAYSLGAVFIPDATCRFSREEGTGSRRNFFVGCPGALAASVSCFVTDRWFTPHFSVVARFCIDAWMADVACPIVCQPIWPAWVRFLVFVYRLVCW